MSGGAGRGGRGLLRSVGPAVIVAAVVCGPGSVLTSSRVGAAHGFSMGWVLVVACALMAGMVFLAGHLGSRLDRSLCTELAERLGRPVAAAVGVVLFLVVAAFQSSNNSAVLGAVEGLGISLGGGGGVAVLVAVNAAVVWALYASRHVYRQIERLMKLLVLVMVGAFFANVVVASPPVGEVLAGLVPRWSAGAARAGTPWELLALVGTTFSVAAAFYQGYLVREKRASDGGQDDPAKRVLDTVVGVGVLGLISLVVMTTAAAAFHGRADGVQLGSFTEVASQLEPLFGRWARYVFGTGLLAAAFSSFLVNAMVGGLVLSDGLGLGGRIDGRWPKAFTVAALAIGMVVAVLAVSTGLSTVRLILVAQALTVLGNPAIAGALVYLGSRPGQRASLPVLAAAWAGLAVTLLLAARTVVRLVGAA